MNFVSRTRQIIQSCSRLYRDYKESEKTGTTSEVAYHNLIWAFCLTQGYSNDWLHRKITKNKPPYTITENSNLLGELDDRKIKSIVQEVKKNGYCALETKLSEELCDELIKLAENAKCQITTDDSRHQYDPKNPISTRYMLDSIDIVNNPVGQKLATDPSILKIAQRYLGCQPILDIVTMWWSPKFKKEADSNAAQLFHFDMDRIKWLKVFFYLTDVDENSGPHTFVKKSHRSLGIPFKLLKKGYARLTDQEVGAHYKASDLIEMKGKKGTILFEDTRGLHKGKTPTENHRLIFQLEFTSSLFGGAYGIHQAEEIKDETAQHMVKKYPKIYQLFFKQ